MLITHSFINNIIKIEKEFCQNNIENLYLSKF